MYVFLCNHYVLKDLQLRLVVVSHEVEYSRMCDQYELFAQMIKSNRTLN